MEGRETGGIVGGEMIGADKGGDAGGDFDGEAVEPEGAWGGNGGRRGGMGVR